MSRAEPLPAEQHRWSRWAGAAADALQSSRPPFLFGLRLWASVCLALYVAFWLELDTPSWAGATAALVCQPHLGASLRKGWYRLIGTLVGAIAIVVMTACFPQNRAAFLFALALWGAGCAFVANLLRNFAAYSAALAGYTAAIIASDQLGAVGGLNAQAFMLAVTRASEICIGIVCAGVVLAGTDLGGARRRVARLFAELSAEIACRFTGTLSVAGAGFEETQTIRRELVRRVTALDPVVDEALGESAELRYHSPVLQNALDGLIRALTGWRTVAVALRQAPQERAREETGAVLVQMPEPFRASPGKDEAECWLAGPGRLFQACDAAMRRLLALPAATPSLRLLADQAAEALAGISQALNALALLVADPARPALRTRSRRRIRVPDLLSPLANAARAFVVIGVAALFWIVTAWPGGANAITFAAIIVILFSPRADHAYGIAIGFMIGSVLTVAVVATLLFAALPNIETFVGFAVIIGLVLVPIGTVFALQWQPAVLTGMVTIFVPLLAPTNPMSYNPQQYYNTALTILAGSGAAAFSFRLLPPLAPAFRTRRLLAHTLRDLHRLAVGPIPDTPNDWEQRMCARLALLPDQAKPVERSWLVAALSAGDKIVQLRQLDREFGLTSDLGGALEAVARGDSAAAITRFAAIDAALISRPGEATLRARSLILAVCDALSQHAGYFDAGAAG
jgi:uncharacterized membrane protein YccC